MSKIKIMCSSTGCIEYAPERYRNLGIEIIRIHMYFKGKDYLDGLEIDPVEFYRELETLDDPKKNFPRTGVPSPLEIAAHFDKAIEDGYDEIIAFATSSGLGGTYNAFCLAAKEYEGRIKVYPVDTKINSFSEGLLAIKAQEMVNKGMSVEEILKEVRWMQKTQEFMGIDAKLDFLIYGGRLKGAKAFMGQLLNMCPVVHFNREGECVALETVRTPKKALMRTCEIIKEKIGDRSPEDYILFHIYTGPDTIEILRSVEGKYGIETNHEAVIMSPISGCHNGPWLAGYGLLFLRRPDEPLDD